MNELSSPTSQKNEPEASNRNVMEESSQGMPVRIVDAFNLWATLCIAPSIPLGRLEWTWTNRGVTNRESSLTARAVFSPLDSQAITEPPMPSRADEWFRRAYVHMLLVPIEELLLQRESPAWKYLRKFVEQCREKRFEYIVGVVADSETAKQNRKLMDRVRQDVNLTRRERVVNIPTLTLNRNQKLISHLYHSPPHQELLIRLRECTRDAAQVRLQHYESELERLYPKRANPDWSFCYFFSVKESMGFVFCQLGRRDLALRLLDELHVFMVEYDEKDSSRVFCNESPCEAAKNISSTSGKDYAKLFADNSITEMEIRTYLFSRQTEIMLPDKKFSDIAERGLKLITAVSRRCIEEASKSAGPSSSCFRDAWVFTAARILASTLSVAIPNSTPDTGSMSPQLGTPKERHTARLIAGFHVHALKAFVGLAKVLLPGTMTAIKDADTGLSVHEKKKVLTMLSSELRDALSTANNAEISYSEIANAAASLYEMGGRSRGAAALDGDAGVIRLRNGSLSEAEKLLSAQCSRFSDDHSWDDLHVEKRKELARAEKRLGKVQEYLVSCLTILFMTRASRKTTFSSESSHERNAANTELAVKWAKETYETACKLPRVMKYKAEKLLSVCMRPGAGNWFEGDAGKAVVVIVSDIPAVIRVDSLFVEFKSVFQLESKPSPEPRKGTSESLGASKAGTLTMKSKPVKISILPGTNEIPVHAAEVPWPGRYVANLVALFVGKLKLVQIAPKLDSYPIVGIKGTSSQRASLSKVTNVGQQPDIGKAWVKFPSFYAERRAAPASIKIVRENPLFLVSGSMQPVVVEVKSELHGIDRGLGMKIRIVFPADVLEDSTSAGDAAELEIVKVLKVAEVSSSSSSLPFISNNSEGNKADITINETVKESSVIHVHLSIQVPTYVSDCGTDNQGLECSIEASLNGRELSSSSRRAFSCSTSEPIYFVNPMKCESRIDTRTSSVSASGSLDANAGLGVDGGMLLCTVQSLVSEDRRITLQKASLELPHWLRYQEDVKQPHEDLLPCTISQRTRFVFAFDLLTCGTPVIGNELGGKAFSGFSKRRYSRRSKDASDLGASIENEKQGVREAGSELRIPGLASTSGAVGHGLDTSRSSDLELSVQGGEFSPMEGVTEDVEMMADEAKDASPKSPEVPEIGEVVDLSGSQNVTEEDPRKECYARLRVEFEIQGFEGTAFVDRLVNVRALRPGPWTYRIERSFPRYLLSGRPGAFKFCVRLLKNPNFADGSGEAEQELLYDVNASPLDWVVSGRKRGTITLSQGTSAVVYVDVVPLRAGRIAMPVVELFGTNCRVLPEHACENVNQGLQIVVCPGTFVTCLCARSEGDACVNALRMAAVSPAVQDPKADAPAAGMPQVVAFDSFL